MNQNTTLMELKGIGEKSIKLYHKLDLYTVEDLLEYIPRDYDKMEAPILISDLKIGELSAVKVSIAGNVQTKKIKKLIICNFMMKDTSGMLHITYFNTQYIRNVIKPNN